jgi:hypothetical protein
MRSAILADGGGAIQALKLAFSETAIRRDLSLGLHTDLATRAPLLSPKTKSLAHRGFVTGTDWVAPYLSFRSSSFAGDI